MSQDRNTTGIAVDSFERKDRQTLDFIQRVVIETKQRALSAETKLQGLEMIALTLDGKIHELNKNMERLIEAISENTKKIIELFKREAKKSE